MTFASDAEKREEIDVELDSPLPWERTRRRRRKGVRALPAADSSEIDQFRAVASEIGAG